MKTSSQLKISMAILMGIAFCIESHSATVLTKKQKQSPNAALFAKLDKNKDGKLTRNEIGEKQLKSFQRMLRVGDEDKNGELSRAEFLKALSPQISQPNQTFPKRKTQPFNPQQIFRNLDRNKDGKLELTEVPEGARSRFKPIFDRFEKSSLSLEEFTRAVRQNQQQQNRQRLQTRAREFFVQFDTNKDGKLEYKEAPDARKAFVRSLLQKAEKGENGSLSRAEAMPLIVAALQANQQVFAFFGQYDKNKDRRISKAEAPQRIKDRFDRLDVNKNGTLEYAEFGRYVTSEASNRRDSIRKTDRKKKGKRKTDRRKRKKKAKRTTDKKRRKKKKE